MPKNTIDYPRGLTFEQVWATIQEDHKRFNERHEKFQERHEKFQEDIDKLNAILAQEAKERQEYQRAYEERQKAYEEQRKKAEEHTRKMEESVDKMSISVNRLGINVGGLSNSFGELAEHLVAPNIAERFDELGYSFSRIYRNGVEIKENGQVVTEVDILLENGKTIAIVEVKARPTKSDVRQHLKRMQIVRRDNERRGTSNKELIGAIAGAVFPINVKNFAIETGFYVITQSGDTVKIDVPKDFKPRIF
ncbi:MAG: hypothetical protein LBJ00_17175 [Planctomycetaceae bacterium]|jgi:hypothetical protein|nr:hypothetical protein [Planctomycetaceae bacterium]